MAADRDPLADVMADWWEAGPVPATHEGDASLLREILARHGLAAVPVEPTEAMCRAGFEAEDEWPSARCDNVREIRLSYARPRWRAMVAAAQQEARDADQG